MRRWFLSYHSPDQALAERLKDAIQRKDADSRVFFAPISLRAGGYWQPALAKEIEEADAFVLLVGEKGLGPWQQLEYYAAHDKHVKSPGFPVVLMLLDGHAAPGLPFLRQLHWIVSGDPASEKDVARLFDAVAGVDTRPGELWRHTSPYRGLSAMEEKDADYFFGRERETVDVLSVLAADTGRLPVLLGNSGVGKSSLAQAGVMAALRRQAWPLGTVGTAIWPHGFSESRGWCFLTLRPGGEPIKALVEAFLQIWQFDPTDPRRETRRTEWVENLRLGANTLIGLLDATEGRLQERGQSKPPGFFLYVDQGEELYVRAEEGQRLRFSELLGHGLGDPRLRALMSLRADFLGALQNDEVLYATHRQINVPPLREADLRTVVARPAEILSARFEFAGLAGDIARRAAEESVKDAGALPLLSYLLDDMWTQMVTRGDGVLRLPPQAMELGGVLAERANAFLARHPKDEERLRRLFTLKLASVREDGEPTRRRAPRSECSDEEWHLISELADHPHRLLITAMPERGETYAEVAHEKIFQRWDKLRDWIAAEREFLIWKSAVEADRRRWGATAESSRNDALLMGLALAQAQSWLARRAEDLPRPDREFIDLSGRMEAERRDAIRQLEIDRIKAEEEIFRLRSEKEARTQRERADAEELARLRSEKEARAQRERAELAEYRTRRMERWQARFAAVAAFVFAGIAALAVWQYFESVGLRKTAETARQTAEIERQRAETDRNQALVIQSRFLVDLARQQYEANDYGTAIALGLEVLSDVRLTASRLYLPDVESVIYQSVVSLRERRDLVGHGEEVKTVAFSPDGTKVVTASWDNTARIWDAVTGTTIAVLQHGDRLEAAAFSSDGKRVVTASSDKTARIWDAATGERLAVLENHTEKINNASFSPDGLLVVTASDDKTARIWSVATKKELSVLRHGGWVYSAAFSPDSKKVVTSSNDKTACIWDAGNGNKLACMEHKDTVFSAEFSPDGGRIVTASWDTTAGIWNAADGSRLQKLPHVGAVLAAAFSPDGSQVVTAAGSKAHVWDATTGAKIALLSGHAEDKDVVSASFSHNGKSVATASNDMTARIWNAASGAEEVVFRGHEGVVRAAKFSPNGLLVVTASDDKTARIWDGTADLSISVMRGHGAQLESAAFSPDGLLVVTASDDWTARIWNATTGTQVAALQHDDTVKTAAFSPDGRRIVTASLDGAARIWDAADAADPIKLQHDDQVVGASYATDGSRIVTASLDKTARIWNAKDGALVHTLAEHGEPVMSASFSRDGKRVVTASRDSFAFIWDAESGKKLLPLAGHENWVRMAVFSNDGKHVATASQDARIWDAATGETIAKLEHKDQVYSAAFAPDGERVVTASWDNTAAIWDLKGNAIAVLRGHTDRVQSAMFSPDGRRVLTASWDKTARLWDSVTGLEVGAMRGHNETIQSAVFSPNGKFVVTASDDRTARVWRVFATTQDLIDHVRSIMPRELSPEQRARFFLAPPQAQQ